METIRKIFGFALLGTKRSDTLKYQEVEIKEGQGIKVDGPFAISLARNGKASLVVQDEDPLAVEDVERIAKKVMKKRSLDYRNRNHRA